MLGMAHKYAPARKITADWLSINISCCYDWQGVEYNSNVVAYLGVGALV